MFFWHSRATQTYSSGQIIQNQWGRLRRRGPYIGGSNLGRGVSLRLRYGPNFGNASVSRLCRQICPDKLQRGKGVGANQSILARVTHEYRVLARGFVRCLVSGDLQPLHGSDSLRQTLLLLLSWDAQMLNVFSMQYRRVVGTPQKHVLRCGRFHPW